MSPSAHDARAAGLDLWDASRQVRQDPSFAPFHSTMRSTASSAGDGAVTFTGRAPAASSGRSRATAAGDG